MSGAETLRRAAALMRTDWDATRDMAGITLTDPHWRRGKTWLAVADWLEYVAQTWRMRPVADRGPVHGGDQEQALAVARTYLGSDA